MVPNREHPPNACYYAHIATQARFGLERRLATWFANRQLGFRCLFPWLQQSVLSSSQNARSGPPDQTNPHDRVLAITQTHRNRFEEAPSEIKMSQSQTLLTVLLPLWYVLEC